MNKEEKQNYFDSGENYLANLKAEQAEERRIARLPQKRMSVAERIREADARDGKVPEAPVEKVVVARQISAAPAGVMVNGRKKTSKYRGVSYQKQTSQWVASISIGGHTFAEYASSEDSAAVVYDKMAVKWLRGRAKTNFPIEGYEIPEQPEVVGVDAFVTSGHIRSACRSYILAKGLVSRRSMPNWTVAHNLFFFEDKGVSRDEVMDWCRKLGIDPMGMDL